MTTALGDLLGDLTHVAWAFGELCDGYLVKPLIVTAIKQRLREPGLVK